ncbi:MAG: T9SS type A sorting domain-containing protein [Chitinophagaceae bacterium]|nr:MAG: T9SS type A sorting domain-containing protein [Chitinophagaceae bacterium]
MKLLYLSLFAMFSAGILNAQSPWSRSNIDSVNKSALKGRVMPQKFQIFKLDQPAMASRLRQAPSEESVRGAKSGFTIELPDVDANLTTFTIVAAPVAAPGLLKKLNGAQSFSGRSVKDPYTMVRFSISQVGLNAIISSPEKPTIYIRSIDSKNGIHIIFTDEGINPEKFECTTPEGAANLLRSNGNLSMNAAMKNANTGNIRVFRLALAASGEFSDQYDNDPENDDGNTARISAVLAFQLTWVTDANFYLERDFGIRVQVIADNDKVIFLDASTDPFIGTDLNAETQSGIDAAIGTANYDIGHLMNYTPGSNAGNAGAIGSICNASTKGRGYTGRADWTALDGYASIMFTHELGHQSGANHTFTHQDDNDNAQIEPGSGSTIMSYGGNGIAPAQYVIGLRDRYFHAISIQQATDYVASVSCGSTVSAGNTAPNANAGPDYTIPKSTAFTLKGTASDAEGDAMTFTWEQMDKITAASDFGWTLSSTNTYGPAFRSRVPSASLNRTLPIDGISDPWEVLSSVPRTFNFRFTTRDNRTTGAQNNSDDVVITVADAGPLSIAAPNGGETICPGNYTVTWAVNGTDDASLAPTVKILLSYDGGTTYPITLAASTPNDGTQQITMPCAYSNTARIKVEAVGNIFFDISNANFTVGDNTKPTFTLPADKTIFKDATCSYNANVSITGDVTDEADNCSTGLNATYVDNIAPGACPGETKITRTWTVTDACMNSTVKVQTITIKDNIAPTFTVPPPITIYKDAACNHNASVAATGDVTDEADNCDAGLQATYTDVETPGACVGNLTITRTWRLVDGCGNATEKVQVIKVEDKLGPVINDISTNPSVLWPVNHKMVKVKVNYTAKDNCSPVTNKLTVASNQPTDGLGDGTTATDWQVVDATTVMLRAERSGVLKTDRIYTITITSKDDCGNISSAPAYVRVPHNQPITGTMRQNPLEVEASNLTAFVTPNPSRAQFKLYISGVSNQQVSIRITDIYGRLIETRKGMFANSVIQVNSLNQAGVYFAEVMQGQLKTVVKLIKQ